MKGYRAERVASLYFTVGIACLLGALSAAQESAPVIQNPAPESAVAARPDASQLSVTVSHEAMGTEFQIIVYARAGDSGTDGVASLAEEAFQLVDDLEARISRWRPDSQTSYINNHAFQEPVKAATDVIDLIEFAQKVYRDTQGAFDPTVGPLVKLWGFYKGEGRYPAEAELSQALACVGFDKVRVDREARTVSFAKEGMMLDFGGIGKGMAVDVAAKYLRENGVTSAILHGGTSSVMAIGSPPGASGWTVGIRDPYNEDRRLAEVELRDESLSTSGSYEKFFELDGKKYCHIFDPRTGRPVDGMLSATAIAPTGMMSDALSTALFVLGPEKAAAYCRAHPEVRAVMIPLPVEGSPKLIWINGSGRELP